MSSEVRWIIGVGITLGLSLAGLIMTQHASMRAEIRENHIALQADVSSLRTDIDGINAELYALNTRISRIEGGLFGIEFPGIQDQHQDPSVEE